MIDIRQLRTIIVGWLGIVNPLVPVIKLYQNSPQPQTGYFGIYIPEMESVEDDYYSQLPTEEGFYVFNTESIHLQLSYYGKDSLSIMRDTISKLKTSEIISYFNNNNLVLVGNEKVVGASNNIDGRFEENASCTIRFRIGSSIVYETDYFDKVDVGDNKLIFPDHEEKNTGVINVP